MSYPHPESLLSFESVSFVILLFTGLAGVPITRLIAGDAVLATALRPGKLLKLLRD